MRKMNIQRQRFPLEVHAIGEAALGILSNAEQGTVLASVTNAVYLLNQHGEICWLIPVEASMHRRGLKTVDHLPRLSVGSKYQVADHTLAINSEVTFDFHQSLIWREPKISHKGIIPKSRLSESLSLVGGHLLALHQPSGLGSLIKLIFNLTTQQPYTLPASFENRIAEKAWPEVSGMIQASLDNDNINFLLHAKSLIGLGEGLTPSGDDFLGGFFYAVQLLQNYYPGTVNLAVCIYSDFILQLKPLTNLLSYTIFMDHTGGHSVEPMHQLAKGILLGAPAEELTCQAERLISLGHSTGWDLLTGLIAGMSIANAQ